MGVDSWLETEDTCITYKQMKKQHNQRWPHGRINIKRRFSLWDKKKKKQVWWSCEEREYREHRGTENVGREAPRKTYFFWVLFSLGWLSHRCCPASTGRITWEATRGDVPLCLCSHTQTIVRELPGGATHPRHKGQCSRYRNKTQEKEKRAGQTDRAGMHFNQASKCPVQSLREWLSTGVKPFLGSLAIQEEHLSHWLQQITLTLT